MADNSNGRKKALAVSVLAFLFIGGGVFLFFIVQGSNDLAKSGKSNFHYGGAARESVVSFFRSVGLVPDEDEALTKQKTARMAARGFLEDGGQAVADVSDWMASNNSGAPSASAYRGSGSPTSVPKMAGTSGSPVGGSGGGGTKSAGGSSRFGEGNTAGNVNVSAKAQPGAGGPADKGTMATLKNARAMLGEGLKSDSAMTARSKWGQSFGVGPAGGKSSGDLAYGKSSLVNLDKIKSGQIASLKAAPDAGAFQRDKEAEKKDAGLNAAKDAASAKSKADAEAEAKKAAAKAAADALAKGMEQGAGGKPEPKSETPAEAKANGEDPGQTPISDEEKAEAKSMAFTEPTTLGNGDVVKDTKVDITRNPDGGATFVISGIQTPPPPGEPFEYKDTVVKAPDGTLTFQ